MMKYHKLKLEKIIYHTGVLVILLQHLLIFILEHLSLNFQIIIKVIISSLVTLALILILEIVKSTKK